MSDTQRTPRILLVASGVRSGSPCKCCPMPAEFQAGYLETGLEVFCSVCVVPFVLQALKLDGASLGLIDAGLVALSEALDAPPKNLLVQ